LTYSVNENKKKGGMGMHLHALSRGERGRVKALQAGGSIEMRLRDLGVIEGTLITCLGKSPLGDPTAYQIRGAVIALRKEDAAKVLIEREG